MGGCGVRCGCGRDCLELEGIGGVEIGIRGEGGDGRVGREGGIICNEGGQRRV